MKNNLNNSIDPFNGVSFSVDAGIINRLGKELVGRAETAVSELVKNSYDADANEVILDFINSDEIGGTLKIIDDGEGMSLNQLVNGFMRLSSTDKLHNPISSKYRRQKAGRKGIGRFATQRLGAKLTIITKTEASATAIKLEVDWNKYQIDTELVEIINPISEISVNFKKGTHLIISELRESWNEPQIKRVFRYVTDLLQPDFLSDRSNELNIASNNTDDYFNVNCYKTVGNDIVPIANIDKMLFNNALGIIEGYVMNDRGICELKSTRFEIDDIIDITGTYHFINDVHFKVYYFIYNYEWYEGYLPKMEYHRINDFADQNGGIRLYRNGFRVLPYGEKGNDWLNIEKTSLKTQDKAYVPFSNNNFFGFVEIIDREGKTFEETSSREGLIENQPLEQLIDFVSNALRAATLRINSARYREKSSKATGSNTDNRPQNDKRTTEEKLLDLKGSSSATDQVIDEAILKLEEIGMLRVLAGIGLNIAEFTHEIRQFIPSFNGSINYLMHQNLSKDVNESLLNLKENFNRFKTYTSYLDNTITQNVNRDKQPIDLRRVIEEFREVISYDLKGLAINFDIEYYGYDLYTCPMHPSEWSSILYNLYTNSKKAIKRQEPQKGKIKIIVGKEDQIIYLEFCDNGDGIPDRNKDRIFDAFFTTSTPPNNSNKNESITGTGLGLKILKDIILGYNGKIFVTDPETDYNTSVRVEIPEATEKTLEQYGI
jgi:signal transduction histidine kinase